MKILLLATFCLSAVLSAPAPIPVDDEVVIPDSQVEVLGGPVRSDGDGDGIFPFGGEGLFPSGVRVIVVRRPSFSGFPFLGQDDGEQEEAFPGGEFNPFSFLGGSDEGGSIPFGGDRIPFGGEGGFNPFLGGEGGEDGAEPRCGLICVLFKMVEDQMSVLQGEIDSLDKEIHQNNNGTDKKECTEEELEDGRIVRKCKTTISDTDEDGNSFFLHQSVSHSIIGLDGDEKEGSAEKDIIEGDKSDGESVVIEEADLTPDPSFNEIPDDVLNEIPDDNTGIDDGLLQE